MLVQYLTPAVQSDFNIYLAVEALIMMIVSMTQIIFYKYLYKTTPMFLLQSKSRVVK